MGSETLIIFLFLSNLLTLWRCNTLSRRIDLVHERIKLNNQLNGLNGGAWDSAKN